MVGETLSGGGLELELCCDGDEPFRLAQLFRKSLSSLLFRIRLPLAPIRVRLMSFQAVTQHVQAKVRHRQSATWEGCGMGKVRHGKSAS